MVFLLSQFGNTHGAKMHCTAEEINFNMRYIRPSVGTEPSLNFLQRTEALNNVLAVEYTITASCFWYGWTGSHGS